jgi:DNA-binding response OmpR family regulator
MDTTQSASYKIVIAEDNVDLADVYKIRLEMIGYQVHIAPDGEQALIVIERERPDLVLLDMMMPRVAGDEVLRRMRQSDWGKDIRVFVMSNLSEEDAPAGLRDYNIEGYAVKIDLREDDLDKLVDKILTPQGQDDDVDALSSSEL